MKRRIFGSLRSIASWRAPELSPLLVLPRKRLRSAMMPVAFR
jgi:hypothetical protein